MAVFTAATMSFGGLVRALGKTLSSGINERSTGIMTIADSGELLSRTSSVSVSGPTGSWAEDWWSVWTYLQYGVGGCIVGGTGSSYNVFIGITYGPLHDTVEPFNVVFGAASSPSAPTGLTSSARAAVNIATKRKDCFALVGAVRDIAGSEISSSYDSYETDFGILDTDWDKNGGSTAANIIFIPNRKNYIRNWNGSIATTTNIGTIDLGPDVAGCFGRTSVNYSPWIVPAGVLRGRILNTVALTSNYVSSDLTIMNNIRLSPVISLPGRGSYFFGNTTAGITTGVYSSASKIDFQAVLNYLRRELATISSDLLFRPNNASTRLSFTTSANTVLQTIFESGSINDYEVICDSSNNTDGTVNMIAKVIIYPVNAVETITLTVTNGVVSEDFTF